MCPHDVFKSLSDLESGESKTTFVAWTDNRIELLAKQFCGDKESHRIKLSILIKWELISNLKINTQ